MNEEGADAEHDSAVDSSFQTFCFGLMSTIPLKTVFSSRQVSIHRYLSFLVVLFVLSTKIAEVQSEVASVVLFVRILVSITNNQNN